MKHNFKKTCVFFLVAVLFLGSCKKETNNGVANSRNVKYEITGSFTGKLTIIYNDNVNGNTVLNNISLPWSKDITYPANITGIGISAQASVTGIPAQTAICKIYSGGAVVKTSSATAGSLGELALPAIAFLF